MQRFTVLDFRNRALPIIEKLMQDGKLPVIVGGTNYYIESLLWKILVENRDSLEQIKSPTETEEIHSDGAGRPIKDCVSDRNESSSVKRKMLDCESANAVLDECGHGARKRVLDSDDGICSYKCAKLQACDVGLNTFSNRCQLNIRSKGFQAQERKEDGVCEGPYLNSADCYKDLDHSDADVVRARSRVLSGSQEVCQDKDIDCDNDRVKPIIAEFQNKDFGSNAVAQAQSEVHSGKDQVEESSQRQRTEVNFELVYDRDRKRLKEVLSGEFMERRTLRVENDVVDLMDEAALEHVPGPHLYERLQAVDPDRAQQLHPNNKRKIIRSLQVYAQTGRTHSAILREQRSEDGGSELGGPLRYPHACILWLQCEQEVLDKRLDLRVDAMLEQGLLRELLDFHRLYNEQRIATSTEPDYSKGIFQSIGFKEFHEYLVLSEEDRSSEKGSKLLHSGVDELKRVTRRYARRQLRWITSRFLRKSSRQVPPMYGLDATDPNFWNEHVLEPAVQIVKSYMEGQKPAEVEPLPVIEQSKKNDLISHHCDVCDRIFIGDIQWNDHLHSRKHHKMLKHKQVHKD
ncbi:tRNA dimethylallyltransferase isoform X2 [Cryptotermes secundus]|nr:tRNA dimethylallyltransferase isoform X2 [Cryptotermes secundus]